jgi:mono/diheme cytochrome c family protein
MQYRLGRADKMRMNGAALLGASVIAACASSQLGANEADLARARSQASQGADVFTAECARCHGQRGEGLAGAPPVLGTGALPAYPRDYGSSAASSDPQQLQIQMQTRPAGAPRRDAFRTATDLYGYVSNHLPKSRASSMKPEDYWSVISFMLAAQGIDLPQGGLNAGNAGNVTIQSRP